MPISFAAPVRVLLPSFFWSHHETLCVLFVIHQELPRSSFEFPTNYRRRPTTNELERIDVAAHDVIASINGPRAEALEPERHQAVRRLRRGE